MGNTITFSVSGQLVLIFCCLIVVLLLVYAILIQGKIYQSLSRIAESNRLSVVLSIEGKNVKSVPEDFAPNKEVIKKRLLDALEKENHPNPDTLAYCILSHSGFESFVNGNAWTNSKKALSRLLTNGDMEKVKVFLTDIVNQL